MKRVLFFLGLMMLSMTSSYGQETVVFENSWWQWVEAANLSDKRMQTLAPHFPNPASSNYDEDLYGKAFLKWQKLYCYEYESLLNAPELVALNPYYTGYIDVVQLPYFIRPLSSYTKPEKPTGAMSIEEEIDHELHVQAWYFVFEPNEFYKIYKIRPEFPEWFNPQDYRNKIIKKIEDNKNSSNGN